MLCVTVDTRQILLIILYRYPIVIIWKSFKQAWVSTEAQLLNWVFYPKLWKKLTTDGLCYVKPY